MTPSQFIVNSLVTDLSASEAMVFAGRRVTIFGMLSPKDKPGSLGLPGQQTSKLDFHGTALGKVSH